MIGGSKLGSMVAGSISNTPWTGVWWTIGQGYLYRRAIHEVIWGIFFLNILGLDPLVAILAIAIPFGAITAKVFSEILDEMPRAPLRTLLNNGASPFAGFFL